MKSIRSGVYLARALVWFCLAGLLLTSVLGATRPEQRFDLLQIGTVTYTNATVTSHNDDYIILMHAGGMASVRVSQIPPDAREKLGYAIPVKAQKSQTNSVSAWAQQKLTSIQPTQLKVLQQHWTAQAQSLISNQSAPSPKIIYIIGASVLICYLLFCYCCSLICRKTGKEASVLIWIPLLQLFPLLRAAGMSPLWFFAFLVPLLNVVAQLLWSVKIVQARGKSMWLAFLLILPPTNPLAFLYLAFSDGKPVKKERAPEIMTLEAA